MISSPECAATNWGPRSPASEILTMQQLLSWSLSKWCEVQIQEDRGSLHFFTSPAIMIMHILCIIWIVPLRFVNFNQWKSITGPSWATLLLTLQTAQWEVKLLVAVVQGPFKTGEAEWAGQVRHSPAKRSEKQLLNISSNLWLGSRSSVCRISAPTSGGVHLWRHQYVRIGHLTHKKNKANGYFA